MKRPTPYGLPMATIKQALTDGYGVENISVMHHVDLIEVRSMVSDMRKFGILDHLFPRKKSDAS